MSNENDTFSSPRKAFEAALKEAPMDPEVSPTGAPSLPSLTGNFGKYLFGLVGICAVVLPLLPPYTILAKVLAAIVGLGGAAGIASPGLRKSA